jgi:hypothetical protein
MVQPSGRIRPSPVILEKFSLIISDIICLLIVTAHCKREKRKLLFKARMNVRKSEMSYSFHFCSP